jgi:hypothetical protein
MNPFMNMAIISQNAWMCIAEIFNHFERSSHSLCLFTSPSRDAGSGQRLGGELWAKKVTFVQLCPALSSFIQRFQGEFSVSSFIHIYPHLSSVLGEKLRVEPGAKDNG